MEPALLVATSARSVDDGLPDEAPIGGIVAGGDLTGSPLHPIEQIAVETVDGRIRLTDQPVVAMTLDDVVPHRAGVPDRPVLGIDGHDDVGERVAPLQIAVLARHLVERRERAVALAQHAVVDQFDHGRKIVLGELAEDIERVVGHHRRP